MEVGFFVDVAASRAMVSHTGRKRLQQRRPLLGCILVATVAAWATSNFQCFIAPLSAGGRMGARRTGSPANLQSLRPGSRTAASAAAMDDEKEEMSDLEKFLDRYNTKGGVILGSVVAILFGLGLEKFLELFVDPIQAGIAVSGVGSIGIFIWTGTYFSRVLGKRTTYAKQLRQYEQMVMMRRLEELDDEEIEALCEEVGVSSEELAAVTGDDLRKNLSKKEQVLKLFKLQGLSQDPRNLVGSS